MAGSFLYPFTLQAICITLIVERIAVILIVWLMRSSAGHVPAGQWYSFFAVLMQWVKLPLRVMMVMGFNTGEVDSFSHLRPLRIHCEVFFLIRSRSHTISWSWQHRQLQQRSRPRVHCILATSIHIERSYEPWLAWSNVPDCSGTLGSSSHLPAP